MKQGAFMEKEYNNEQGYTLLNTLISLMLILLILPLIYQVYFEVSSLNKIDNSYEKFFIFIKDDINRASKVSVSDHQIIFELYDGKSAIIEKYNDQLRRRVDNKGHEIYLRDINSFNIIKLDYGMRLSVISKMGVKYEKDFLLE